MLKDDELVGAIAIYRQEVRPFTDKQIELVQNFAAQAVIAIENTRLLNELRQRTDDLTESLEQQTATSEVLKRHQLRPASLEPVFQAMLENAVRICEAKFGTLYSFAKATYSASRRCTARRQHSPNTKADAIRFDRCRGSHSRSPDADKAGQSISPMRCDAGTSCRAPRTVARR